MNRSALVWFAVGAGVTGAISSVTTHVLTKRDGVDLAVIVYEPPDAHNKDWNSMPKEKIAENNLIAAGAVRACGVTKFSISTVVDAENFTEFTLDLHSMDELNCILNKAYEEHLPIAIEDRNKHPFTKIATATASLPTIDTAP